MKKYYVSALAIGAVFCGFAQKAPESTIAKTGSLMTIEPGSKVVTTPAVKLEGDLVWDDSFDGTHVWTVGTSGQGTFILGNNSNAQVTDPDTGLSGYLGNMASSTAANGFAFFNGVQYLINASVDAQNTWVTSEEIDFTGIPSVILSFEQRYRAFNSDVTYVEFSEDGGLTWTFSEVVNADVVTNAASIQNSISVYLPTNGTSTGMIRFRWENPSIDDQYGSGYGWMVDDVELTETYADEFRITGVFTHDIVNQWDYYQTPVAQTIPSMIGIGVKNEGGSAQTKSVDIEFTLGGTSVYTGVATSASIAPGASDTIWFNTAFTADAVGTYTISAALPDDAILTNNTMSENFAVSDFVYGHNYPLAGTTKLSFPTTLAEIGIGNVYEINADQLLKGIDVNFATGTNGGIFLDVFVYEMASSSVQDVNNFDVVNFTYQVPATVNTSTVTSIVLPSPYTLEAGKLYYVMLRTNQTASEKLAIKSSTKGDSDFSTVCYGPFGEGEAVNNFVGWGMAPAVNLNFNPVLAINEETSSVAISEVFPNPTSGATTINYTLANAETVNVVVLDVTGKVVKNVENSLQLAGEHTVSFDAASLAQGSYYVNIITEGSTVTKKFIKK